MKNRFKVLMLTICLSISLFCFAGCNPFGSSGLEFGGGTDTPYVQHGDDETRQHEPADDHTVRPVDDTIPNNEDWLFESDAFDEAKAQFYGVRTLYTPNAQSDNYLSSETASSILADRQKFNQNAVDQYKYMAKYILFHLVDHYGVQTSSTSEFYNFYADNSLVPSGQPTKTEISYDPATYASVIARDARQIQTSEWTCHLNLEGISSADLDDYYENTYAGTYLSAFVPYLQIRLIETALGIPTANATTIGAMVDTSNNHPTSQAQARINAYASQISQLGIPTTIGTNTINYASMVASDVIGSAYNIVTHGIFLNAVVSGFLNDVAPTFATYTRTEFCDLDANVYFNGGTRGTPTKLGNMDYQEYYSVSYFTREGTTPLADISLDVYIDSRQDIVLDVYAMYIKAGVGYKIDYAGTLHTDSNTHYYYAPEDPDDVVDYNSVVTNNNSIIMYYGMSDDDRDADSFYSAYLDPSKDSFGTQGSANPLYDPTQQVYGGVLARTGEEGFWYLPSDVAKKNGETVDLSDIKVYAPLDVDGVVIIFDIQYAGGGTVNNHTAGDYAFRYLVHIEGVDKEGMEDFDEIDFDE